LLLLWACLFVLLIALCCLIPKELTWIISMILRKQSCLWLCPLTFTLFCMLNLDPYFSSLTQTRKLLCKHFHLFSKLET
jgi:hypothetical protein